MARYDALNYNRNRSEWMHGQAGGLDDRWGRGYPRGGGMGRGARTYVAGDREYGGRPYDHELRRGGYRSGGMRPMGRGYDRGFRGGYSGAPRGGYLGSWSPGGPGSSRLDGLTRGRPPYFTGFGSMNSGAVGSRGYSPVWE